MTATRANSRFMRFVVASAVTIGSAAGLINGGEALAASITVDVTGAPQTNHCNLTDAIQAASTNARVHNCTAGSATTTDTIHLAATTYQGYGKPLLVPATGGPLVIQGQSITTTVIMADDTYGYPTPNPLSSSSVCPAPAALFVGGNLTLQNLDLNATGPSTVGVCQYAGSLTMTSVMVGNTDGNFTFGQGGLRSYPNTSNNHRTITMTNSTFGYDFIYGLGGAIAGYGNVDLTMTGGFLYANFAESGGGALYWSGSWGKMGNLKLSNVTAEYNTVSAGWGGALYLDGDDANATVVLDGEDVEQNIAGSSTNDGYNAGAIFVGTHYGLNKITVSNSYYDGNLSYSDPQQWTMNASLSTYNAVYCTNTQFDQFQLGDEWPSDPPLKGDWTCVFP